MNQANIKKFIGLVRNKPGNPPWNEGHDEAWGLVLQQLPDEAYQPVALVICSEERFHFRPEPGDVVALWRKLCNPAPAIGPADVVAELYRLRSEPVYGEGYIIEKQYVPHPDDEPWTDELKREYLKAIQDGSILLKQVMAPVRHGEWIDVKVKVKVLRPGPPPSVTGNPLLMAVIDAAGGWDAFATCDGEEAKYMQSRLWKAAEDILSRNSPETLRLGRISQALVAPEYRQIESSDATC